jgi:hypothetical protein
VFIERKNRTPAYEAAIAALAVLSPDLRAAAVAEAQQADLAAIADRRYGRQRKAAEWIGWLRHQRTTGIDAYSFRHDWRDHLECRQTDEGRRYLVSHPYPQGLKNLRALVEVCDQERLHCEIRAASWYYPGATLCIAVETAEQHEARNKGEAQNADPIKTSSGDDFGKTPG